MRLYISLILSLIFCTLSTQDGSAQQVILNTNGEQIVIYPDGSWRYYQEADSVLLDKNLKKEELFLQDNDPTNPFEVPVTNPDEIEDLLRMAAEFADLTRKQQKEASIALSEATGDKFEVEAQLEQANANKSLVEPDRIGTLEDDLDNKTRKVKAAKRHLKVVTGFVDEAEKALKLPAPRMEKALSKLMAEHGAYFGAQNQRTLAEATEKDIKPANQQSRNDHQKSGKDNKPETKDAVVRKPVQGTYGNDPYEGYQREVPQCQIIQQQIDPNSKELRVTVERGLLFAHTDDELRPYFRQQELVTCNAQLTQIDDNIFVSVEYSIASPNARKNFGALSKGSLFRVKLLDKNEVDLYNIRADRGKIDPYSGNTLFVGQYLIEKEAAKLLSRSEIDKVRVVWSTGYEDYDVYELDFFINQFSCLYSVQ